MTEFHENATVLEKMPCIFKIAILDKPSGKEGGRNCTVSATEKLNDDVKEWINTAIPTHKHDGSCSFIDSRGAYRRYDRRLTNEGYNTRNKIKIWNKDPLYLKQMHEKPDKFTFCENITEEPKWDIKRDFKDVPYNWIPTTDHPDNGGHWLGFCKLDEHKIKSNGNITYKQDNDKWHHHAITPDGQGFYTLCYNEEDKQWDVETRPFKTSDKGSWELVGPMVQGNMYNLPEHLSKDWRCNNSKCKKKNDCDMQHYFIRHGSHIFKTPPPTTFNGLWEFMGENDIEGVVWHGTGEHVGKMCKVHREHLQLEKCKSYDLNVIHQ